MLQTALTIHQVKAINEYLISCIDGEGYEVTLTTNKEKVNFVYATFNKEYSYPENIKRYPNEVVRFAEWLAGLPSCFNIECYNGDIIARLQSFYLLSTDSSEKKIETAVSGWFKFIAQSFFKLYEAANTDIKVLIVKGKEWFDKVNGNSYFSARVLINNNTTIYIPFEYGYGNFYIQAAQQHLTTYGYNCGDGWNVEKWANENGVTADFTMITRQLKKDVKEWGIC